MNESTGVIVEEKELRQEPAGWLAVCCGRMELSVGSGKQALKEDATEELVAAGFAARAVVVLCGLGGEAVSCGFDGRGKRGAVLSRGSLRGFLLGMCGCAGGDYSAEKEPRSF